MARAPKTAPAALELRAAQLIRTELDAQEQTIQWLADAVGLSRPQVSKVLHGLKPATLTEIELMCGALSMDLIAVIQQARDA